MNLAINTPCNNEYSNMKKNDFNNFDAIIENIKVYVTKLFNENIECNFPYHNFEHTESVAKNARLIAKKLKFSEKETFILVAAAWFHDTGYLIAPKNHEDRSKNFAKNFLNKYNIDNSCINEINNCIEATRFPQNPNSKLSYALCDADLYHLSESDFFKKSVKLWREINILSKEKVSIHDYWHATLKLFEQHSYHTQYGKQILAVRKEKNHKKLLDKISNCSNKK